MAWMVATHDPTDCTNACVRVSTISPVRVYPAGGVQVRSSDPSDSLKSDSRVPELTATTPLPIALAATIPGVLAVQSKACVFPSNAATPYADCPLTVPRTSNSTFPVCDTIGFDSVMSVG